MVDETLPPEAEQPQPLTFAELGCSEPVLKALYDMGFEHATPVQKATFAPMLAGRDIMVQSQTGTGKTAAFGIPIAEKLVTEAPGVQAMVLVPTRELAQQVAEELTRVLAYRPIKVVAVYGGAAMGRQVDELSAGAQVLVGTPGRVLDHLRRGTLRTAAVRLLVLDEADEMLSMGFERELTAILRELPSSRQTVLFSATIPADIQRLAERTMQAPEFFALSSDQIAAREIRHFMYLVSGAGRSSDLLRIIEFENPDSALLFCNTREETQLIARALVKAGFNSAWISSDLSQTEREHVMASLKEGRLRFLVATDVAARGIDVSNLSHVINVSFPESLEVYVHRTGRTGRMGRTGTAISLITPRDLGNLYFLRLLYKIHPIERELPSEAEERTRRELDQLESLLVDLSGEPGEDYRALTRRLGQHLHGERVIAALLKRHFEGNVEREQEAAQARRFAPPRVPPLVNAPVEPSPAAVVSEAVLPEQAAPPMPSAPRRRRDATGHAGRRESAQKHGGAQPTEGAEAEFWQRYEPAPGAGAPARFSPTSETGEEIEEDDAEEAGMTTLYVNVGRRDGARASEIAKLVQERTGLGADEIGRVRVRNRHTFIGIRSERAAEAIAAITGAAYRDRQLRAEAARAMRV